MLYRWVLTDIPAFKNQPFITTPEDYLIKMEFQLRKINYPNGSTRDFMNTWEKLIKDLLTTDFGDNLGKKDGEDEVRLLTASKENALEKAGPFT
ncbi:MAG: hypothetical protein HC880_13790, partial [Bacteroidia bacterium]|nr:hypothetical protein [Bacteroidia bacterium]